MRFIRADGSSSVMAIEYCAQIWCERLTVSVGSVEFLGAELAYLARLRSWD